MSQSVNLKSPVGRIVLGSLYRANDKDANGGPLLIKTGPNAGTPRVDYFFAIAVAKGQEQHWAQTEWGQQIWAIGHAAFPQAAQSPSFAWKVEDGDSQIPNKKGRKNFETEGHMGHWILKLSGGYAPKVFKIDERGQASQVLEQDFVKPGHFVEVAFSVSGNQSTTNPGVYLNHNMVCFRGYHPDGEIHFGPDANAVGFGATPLPQGASMVPPTSGVPMPTVPKVGDILLNNFTPSLIPAIPNAGVIPNPQFLNPAPAVAQSTIPVILGVPTPSVPIATTYPSRVMTAKANGATYEQFMASGQWTDALLIQHGMMV